MKPGKGVGYFGHCDYYHHAIQSETVDGVRQTVYWARESSTGFGGVGGYDWYHRSCARKLQKERAQRHEQWMMATGR